MQRTMTSLCIATSPASAVLFLDTSRARHPDPDTFFSHQLKMAFKVVASAIWVSYSVFLGLSHIYRRYACY